jgi:hypothetical protein
MLPVEYQSYAITLRDKSAEFDALRALDAPNKELTLPIVVAASFFVRDQEKKRQLTKEEYLNTHLGRIAKSWGRRTCLLDPRFLKFDRDAQRDAFDLAKFLGDTTVYGCSIIPVCELRTSELRRSVISSHWQSSNNGVALRLTLNDLSDPKLGTAIQTLLLKMVLKPQQCVLVLDLSDADLSDVDAFAAFQAEWILRTQEFGLWRRTVSSATNYPEANPAPENGQIKIARSEWLAWNQALSLDPRIGKLAIFGDFGADNANIDFGGAGRALKHIRYATRDEWLVVRGGRLTPFCDGSIQDVARRIILSGVFAGELFSAGDEFIAACANGLGGKGNPTTWRAANMNHHMTRVTQDIADNLEITIPAVLRRKSIQNDFFYKLTN